MVEERVPRLDAAAYRPEDLDTWTLVLLRTVTVLGWLAGVTLVLLAAAVFTDTDLTPMLRSLRELLDVVAVILSAPVVVALGYVVREGLRGRRQSANAEHALRSELPDHLAAQDEQLQGIREALAALAARPAGSGGMDEQQQLVLLEALLRCTGAAARAADRLKALENRVMAARQAERAPTPPPPPQEPAWQPPPAPVTEDQPTRTYSVPLDTGDPPEPGLPDPAPPSPEDEWARPRTRRAMTWRQRTGQDPVDPDPLENP